MEKHEFEKLVGTEVSEEDWLTIETVYQWYPLISEVHGKAQVAWLYTNLGVNIFKDLLERASRIAQLDVCKQTLKVTYEKEVNEVSKRIGKISKFSSEYA